MRTEKDIFYKKEIGKFEKEFEKFESKIYLSREETTEHEYGYVTKWLTAENVANFEEFYICGSPEMVKDARAKLAKLGVEKERIFWEQY